MVIEEPHKIGVVLASRGTMFSRTMDSVFKNIRGFNCELYMSHDLPIPYCFNEPLSGALKDNCDVIWFVEEDMVFPDNTFKLMLDEYMKGYRLVTTEYADKRTGDTLVKRKAGGEVLYTGMGCLLIGSTLMRRIGLLKTGTFWMTDDGYEYKPDIPQRGYGTQDVYLCYKATQLGVPLHIVDIKVGHMILEVKGKDCKSDGVDTVKIVYLNEPTNTK